MSILNQIAASPGLIEPAPASTPMQQVANSTTQTDKPEPPQVNTVNTPTRENSAVIEHLRQQQRAWLERVAALLNTTADDLLARGLIDANDMAEQHRTDPRHAAKLIASCPDWQAMVRVRG
jgi:hypothetical protein|tara:strand:+ start:3818 stop:4180 length:363 start_codon:yes stop_codon:yes gene_type:complete